MRRDLVLRSGGSDLAAGNAKYKEPDGRRLTCCWALMLLMVTIGHHLALMLLLAGLMLAEKFLSRGVLFAGSQRTVGS